MENYTRTIYKGTNYGMTVNFRVDGVLHTMGATEYLIFNAKSKLSDTTVVINVESQAGSNHLVFLPADTQELVAGEYVYDITFIASDGAIIKLVPPSTLIIAEVVANV